MPCSICFVPDLGRKATEKGQEMPLLRRLRDDFHGGKALVDCGLQIAAYTDYECAEKALNCFKEMQCKFCKFWLFVSNYHPTNPGKQALKDCSHSNGISIVGQQPQQDAATKLYKIQHLEYYLHSREKDLLHCITTLSD